MHKKFSSDNKELFYKECFTHIRSHLQIPFFHNFILIYATNMLFKMSDSQG